MADAVRVFIYEITRGMARQISPLLLGRQIDGVWHTGIVAYGNEYFFGAHGISYCEPGGLVLGQPDEVVELGCTEIPRELFEEYLISLSQTTFRGECYHLFDHNCNTFSNEVAMFLTGNSIPARITSLPTEVLNTPFGQMIRPLIDNMMGSFNQSINVGASNFMPSAMGSVGQSVGVPVPNADAPGAKPECSPEAKSEVSSEAETRRNLSDHRHPISTAISSTTTSTAGAGPCDSSASLSSTSTSSSSSSSLSSTFTASEQENKKESNRVDIDLD